MKLGLGLYRELLTPEHLRFARQAGATHMLRVLRILHQNRFDGVLVPDHTPLLDCAAPWHAGMAYALGWMKAAMTAAARG